MKDVIFDVFTEVVTLLHEEEYIKLESYFMDGTKIEANANKYSWVWGKNTKRFKAGLQEKCKRLFEEIELTNEQENQKYEKCNLEELGNGQAIDSEATRGAGEKINEKLAKEPKNRTLKKAKRLVEKDYLPRMEKYEKQEEILLERRSYSKTDQDATFMRMKEDHMKNGQLKPGYNVKIGTENQFILDYSIHQRPGDTSCMKEHLERAKEVLGELPENIVTDAGYGSEENYEYLKEEKVKPYVKYNTFHKEAAKKWKEDITKVQNWIYDEEKDEYICGCNRKLIFVYERNEKSANGYMSTVRIYRGTDCGDCPHREGCVKSKKPGYNRQIGAARTQGNLIQF